jgi:predicted dinucleotide-binding enzyme
VEHPQADAISRVFSQGHKTGHSWRALSDVFVVGDDAGAKQTFFELTQCTPFRYIDAGSLKNARTIERMTLLSGEMGQRYGFFPRMNYKLLGDQWRPGSADAIGSLIART